MNKLCSSDGGTEGTEPSVATLIGDVVAFPGGGGPAGLHESPQRTLLDEANAQLQPVVPLRITVGDEYQGCFATRRRGGARRALAAAAPRAPSAAAPRRRLGQRWRCWRTSPRVEDGPGWWAAREAIEAVKQTRPGRPPDSCARPTGERRGDRRTGPGRGERGADVSGPDDWLCLGAVAAAAARHASTAGPRPSWPTDEGISASAVSQRVRHDGLAVIVAADELLRRVTDELDRRTADRGGRGRPRPLDPADADRQRVHRRGRGGVGGAGRRDSPSRPTW